MSRNCRKKKKKMLFRIISSADQLLINVFLKVNTMIIIVIINYQVDIFTLKVYKYYHEDCRGKKYKGQIF